MGCIAALYQAVFGASLLNFKATSNATANKLPMNSPIPFQPHWCQNTPPAVPATLDPA